MNQQETKKICYWTGSLELEKESRCIEQPKQLAHHTQVQNTLQLWLKIHTYKINMMQKLFG